MDIFPGISPFSFAVIPSFFLFINAYPLAFINLLFPLFHLSSIQFRLINAYAYTFYNDISQHSHLLAISMLDGKIHGNQGKLSLMIFFPAIYITYSDGITFLPSWSKLVVFSLWSWLAWAMARPILQNPQWIWLIFFFFAH